MPLLTGSRKCIEKPMMQSLGLLQTIYKQQMLNTGLVQVTELFKMLEFEISFQEDLKFLECENFTSKNNQNP